MKYTYNINGGKYHYMHIKYIESEDLLRFRVRRKTEKLEIKIPNFTNLVEGFVNDRCGELGLIVSDIINYIDRYIMDSQPAEKLIMWDLYMQGDAIFYALYTMLCDMFDIEN